MKKLFTIQNFALSVCLVLTFSYLAGFAQKKKKIATVPDKSKRVVKTKTDTGPKKPTADPSDAEAAAVDMNMTFGKEFVFPDKSAWDVSQPFGFNVQNLDDKSVVDFMNKTMIARQPKTGDPMGAPESLEKMLEENIGPQAVDKLKNKPYFDKFPLADKLKLNSFAQFSITPFLGDNVKMSVCVFTTVKDVVKQTQPQVDAANSHLFTPAADQEARWVQKPMLTEPPILNDHTRWMLEYDMHRQDPVAIWKRTNSKRSPTTFNDSTGDTSPATFMVISNKPFRPTANRDILISVRNFHPYRDSLALSVDYFDRNQEHADLFTSSFNNAFHLGGAQGAAAAKTAEATAGEEPDTTKGKLTMLQLFTELRDELKAYYTQKFNQPIVDINVLTTGIYYIKQNMGKQIGITDFSETGITKFAEDNADKTQPLDAYFAIVRDAVKYYLMVTHFNYFDNKSVLVQNKDAIQLTLNRYTDGKLQTSPNEAQRLYNISGGFKIDFSLGMYGSTLVDKLYSSTPVTVNDTTYLTNSNGTVRKDSITAIAHNQRNKIIRDGRGSFSVGPAILTHLYWKTGREINAGFTAGFSIDQQAAPRYLLGGSLLFGLERRWVLSYGAAFGTVKMLASGLTEGQIVDLSTYPNSTLPTKDVWQAKGFVAITFNFSGFNVSSSTTK